MKPVFEELKNMDIAIFTAERFSLSSDITLCSPKDWLQLLRTAKPTHCFVEETRYEGSTSELDSQLMKLIIERYSPQSEWDEEEEWVWNEVPKMPTVQRIKEKLRDLYALAEKYSENPYERSYCFIVHGIGYIITECYSKKAQELLRNPRSQMCEFIARYDSQLRKDFAPIEQHRREIELTEREAENQQIQALYDELINQIVNDAEFAQCTSDEKRKRYMLSHYIEFGRQYPDICQYIYAKRGGNPSLTFAGKELLDVAYKTLKESNA